MNRRSTKWPIVLLLFFAPLIGWIKGSEARQKYIFKIRRMQDDKRFMAQEKKVVRSGGVALDDIELSAYHKS